MSSQPISFRCSSPSGIRRRFFRWLDPLASRNFLQICFSNSQCMAQLRQDAAPTDSAMLSWERQSKLSCSVLEHRISQERGRRDSKRWR
jgi:hypothetical protein